MLLAFHFEARLEAEHHQELYIKIKAAIGKKGMFCLAIKKIFGDWNITIDKNLKEKPSSKR